MPPSPADPTHSGRSLGRLILCLGLFVTVAAPAAAEPPRTVRLATEGANPPFTFVGPGYELQGFEIELAKAICAAMAATCSFAIQDWDGLIDGLEQNRYDAIVSSMAITNERRQRIAFSKRYYRIPWALVGPKDSSVTGALPADLAGKTVGTQARSETESLLDDLYNDTTHRAYDKLDEANLDLLTGRLDLVLGDKLALARFLESREGTTCCRFIADVPDNPTYNGEGVGVGLRKSDKDLKARFNAAIDKVIADGTYDRLRAKYFAFDIK
jgi:polar amino acid transport system substrate-binding protein